jgi:hypothetical protein
MPGAFYRIRRRVFGILPCRKSLRDVWNKAQRAQISGSPKVALRYDADACEAKIQRQQSIASRKGVDEEALR